jgi:hypothetical protein
MELSHRKKRSKFIPTQLIFILEYICIIYICLFLSVLFRYNTLHTYSGKNILLIIGVTFSVFLGPGNIRKFFNVRLQCGQ